MHYELLLVDDEPSVTQALSRTLKNNFAKVHQASSGQEALDILSDHPVDVVISDYRMPNMNGSELLTQVRQKYPDIVTLMLSGQADMAGFSKALNDGAISKFLCKPWSNSGLKLEVMRTLEAHEDSLLYDKLTQLPRMKLLVNHLSHLSSNESRGACVALIDICQFTRVNDEFGTRAGNLVLKTIARRLNLLFPDSLVARIKADKFAIVLQNEVSISEDTQAILRALSVPVSINNFELSVKGRIGITAVSDWLGNSEQHFERNIHQLSALASDVQPVIFCNVNYQDIWLRNASFISELQSAIAHNQLNVCLSATS